MIKPFKLSVSKKTLKAIYEKVKKYPWNNIENIQGWKLGTNYNYLKKISKYWYTKYNWKKQEDKINSLSNYITYVNNLGNGYQIAVMDIKRKYTHTISRGVLDEAPSFAPNGKMILYATKKKKKGILVATSSDGRIRKEIQIVGEDVREPVWSNK